MALQLESLHQTPDGQLYQGLMALQQQQRQHGGVYYEPPPAAAAAMHQQMLQHGGYQQQLQQQLQQQQLQQPHYQELDNNQQQVDGHGLDEHVQQQQPQGPNGSESDSGDEDSHIDANGVRMRQSSREVSQRVSLAVLEGCYNIPLTAAAKKLKVSNTMLKKLCRRYGIQRWPHRQIRSIDKEMQKHQEMRAHAPTATEAALSDQRIEALQKKRVIVTKTASCGLNASLRSAIFMARPGEIDADQLFSSGVIPAFQAKSAKSDERGNRSVPSSRNHSPMLPARACTPETSRGTPLQQRSVLGMADYRRQVDSDGSPARSRGGGSGGDEPQRRQSLPQPLAQSFDGLPHHLTGSAMSAAAAAAAAARSGNSSLDGSGGGGGGGGVDAAYALDPAAAYQAMHQQQAFAQQQAMAAWTMSNGGIPMQRPRSLPPPQQSFAVPSGWVPMAPIPGGYSHFAPPQPPRGQQQANAAAAAAAYAQHMQYAAAAAAADPAQYQMMVQQQQQQQQQAAAAAAMMAYGGGHMGGGGGGDMGGMYPEGVLMQGGGGPGGSPQMRQRRAEEC